VTVSVFRSGLNMHCNVGIIKVMLQINITAGNRE
jgi:hypothetical protein